VEHARPAGPEDMARCRELLAAARQEAGTRRGGDRLPAGDLVTGPTRLVLVGEFEGAVVGLAAGHLRPPHVGWVDCCYVEPAARQVGVGGALMAALLGWFAERGCTDVDAVALPGDRETKQLYEAAGFSARLLVLHRPLPG
jgi:GNAT superfamily N-acetyltransferase